MALTPEVVADILAHYKQTRSPFKTAHAAGVTVSEVFDVIEENADQLTTAPERYGGNGRPEMAQYAVGKRRASEREWNNDDPLIAIARANFEAGTHIMATGRDGAFLILYSIPRKGRPDPMPGYFLPEVA